MCTFRSLSYAGWDNRVMVFGDYTGHADSIEELIRSERASKLDISIPDNLPYFPCVTFITYLDVSRICTRHVLDISNAIRAMVALEGIALSYEDVPYGDDAITDAIASHPSIKKVSILGTYENTISTMVRRNRKIVGYSFGPYVGVDYRYGNILAPATWIKQLRSVSDKTIFRDGLFTEFVKRNPDIGELMLAVLRVSEVVRALRYLRSIDILRIECMIQDDVSSLVPAIIEVLARCHPIRFEIYDGKEWVTQPSVWPNCHVIHRENLPKWNHTKSVLVSDVAIHTFNN